MQPETEMWTASQMARPLSPPVPSSGALPLFGQIQVLVAVFTGGAPLLTCGVYNACRGRRFFEIFPHEDFGTAEGFCEWCVRRMIVDPSPSSSLDICAICDMRRLLENKTDFLCVVVVAWCLVSLLVGSTHP